MSDDILKREPVEPARSAKQLFTSELLARHKESDAKEAWKCLDKKEKKKWHEKLEPLRQKYIEDCTVFVQGLDKEELEMYTELKQKRDEEKEGQNDSFDLEIIPNKVSKPKILPKILPIPSSKKKNLKNSGINRTPVKSIQNSNSGSSAKSPADVNRRNTVLFTRKKQKEENKPPIKKRKKNSDVEGEKFYKIFCYFYNFDYLILIFYKNSVKLQRRKKRDLPERVAE